MIKVKQDKTIIEKVPDVVIDDTIDEKYKDKVLFPDKLARDNEALKRLGLPNGFE